MPGLGDMPLSDEDTGWQSAATMQMGEGERYTVPFTTQWDQGLGKIEQTLRPLRSTLVSGLEAISPSLVAPDRTLSAEEAKQYEVPGYLKYDGPVSEGDAQLDNYMARQRQWNDTVMSRTDPNMLGDLVAGFGGALTDPVNDALALSGIGDGLAGLAFGEKAAAAGEDVTQGLSRISRVVKGAPEAFGRGLIQNAPFAVSDFALDYGSGRGDEFNLGDELRNMAGFAMLHAGLHAGGRFLGTLGRDPMEPAGEAEAPGATVPPPEAEAAPGTPEIQAGAADRPLPSFMRGMPEEGERIPAEPTGLDRPREVNMATTEERMGSEILAEDQFRQDEPVDVAQHLITAVQAREGMLPGQEGGRVGGFETAGGVSYTVDPDGQSAVTGAVADPRTPGAPQAFVTPEQAAQLAQQPQALADMQPSRQPAVGLVPVQMTTDPTGAPQFRIGDPITKVTQANGDIPQPMSEGERAFADAQHLDEGALGDLAQAESHGAHHDVVRDFLGRLGGDGLVDERGRVTKAGWRRMQAATLAKAYGDKDLVLSLLDDGDKTLGSLGEALKSAAEPMAQLAEAVRLGKTPAAFDIREPLTSAALLTKAARELGKGVAEFVSDDPAAGEMFTGDFVGETTEMLLRLFHRNDAMTLPTAAEKVAGVLRDWSREAVGKGEELFSHETAVDQVTSTLGDVARRYVAGWDERAGIQRAPGVEPTAERPGGAGGEAEAGGQSLPELGGAGGEPGGGGVPAEGGGEPGEGGGVPRDIREERPGGPGDTEAADTAAPAAGEPRREPAAEGAAGGGGAAEPERAVEAKTAQQIVQESPELRDLAHQLADVEAESGKPIEFPEGRDPMTWAEAIRAVAACMVGELEET